MSISLGLIFITLAFSFNLTLAQEETRAKFREKFAAADFIYNLANKTADSSGIGGKIYQVNLAYLPSLAGEGVSLTYLEIDPCSINTPHSHPRATEIVHIIEGENVQVGFVEENGGRVIINALRAGQTTFIPQGLVHYAQNLGCVKTKIIAAFNSEDPGVINVGSQTLMFPREALSATLNIDESQLDGFKKGIRPTPTAGYANTECVIRCRL